MTDEELQRVICELDLALVFLRKQRGHELDSGDVKIRAMLADVRRELAVYRAISQTAAKTRRA
jgi:hypothetical protein